MKKYGCIGKKLTHSFSKEIHAKLADYDYELIELSEEEIAPFFEKRDFEAINVTIPYKQRVLPYLDFVSDVARRIGAVNTIVKKDGRLYGYNTDYYGMKALIERAGIDCRGKKVLVLGSGGTGKTAFAVAQDLGACEVLTVSRSSSDKCISYDQAVKDNADAEIIINTTPLGMYPNCLSKPIDISGFACLEGVIDAVYNPLSTNLVLDARERGVKAEGGLYMLVMQAAFAVEKFLDTEILKDVAERVYEDCYLAKENIILIGMPGSGKSTVGRMIKLEGYEFVDTDKEIEERCGCRIEELIKDNGEEYFRNLEAEVIKDISSKACRIISTGGGAVLRDENVRCLKNNGRLFFIDAPLSRLRATSDRPLSDTDEKLAKLYAERIDIYKSAMDVLVPFMETPKDEADFILKNRRRNIF